MEITDQQLIEQSVRGDKDAFADLVTRYQTLVCSVAYVITGDFARSEDLGQDAFIAAWKQLNELNDRSRFKSWISSITRNLARNAMRDKRKLRSDDFSDSVADMRLSPAEEASRNEEQSLVWSALSALPDDYREPLVLFYRQDQSVAEVASALDVSTDVAKQRLSRGRKMLRDEVVALVERTLKRTTPSRAFTIAVLAALPTISATAATAAATGSTMTFAKSAVGTVAAKTGGTVGAVFGGVTGIAGASLGTWASWTTAQYQSQRDFIRRESVIFIVGIAIFSMPFMAMFLGWRPRTTLGSDGYLIAYGIWMTLFMTANLVWIFRGISKWKQLTNAEQAAGTPELPTTPARRWLAQWEGRRWSSRHTLFGLAIIDVAFSDPSSELSPAVRRQQGTARGWFAIGDYARGRLLAVGNVAIAPFAMGTISIGMVSVGVLSIGLLSFGVVSLAVASLGIIGIAVWSIGGAVAIGYVAAGPVAVAWEAAYGAVALAFNYAEGAKAIAQHSSDPEAKTYFETSKFFQIAIDLLNRVVAISRSRSLRWAPLLALAMIFVFLRLLILPQRDR